MNQWMKSYFKQLIIYQTIVKEKPLKKPVSYWSIKKSINPSTDRYEWDQPIKAPKNRNNIAWTAYQTGYFLR